MTWEYLETFEPGDLPGLGQEGWELAAAVPVGGHIKYLLKRPAADLKHRFSLEQIDAFFAGPQHSEVDQVSALLNADAAALLRRLGHTDMLIMPDKGFPIPPGVETVDLALSVDVPTVPQIMAAIGADFPFDRLICAEELRKEVPVRFQKYQ